MLGVFLIGACTPQKPQRPVRKKVNVERKYLLRFNEALANLQQNEINDYIKKDSFKKYISSGEGFYYAFVKRGQKKIPIKTITQKVFDLKGVVLSHKKIIHLQPSFIRSGSFPNIYRYLLPKLKAGDSITAISAAFATGIGGKNYRIPVVINFKTN